MDLGCRLSPFFLYRQGRVPPSHSFWPILLFLIGGTYRRGCFPFRPPNPARLGPLSGPWRSIWFWTAWPWLWPFWGWLRPWLSWFRFLIFWSALSTCWIPISAGCWPTRFPSSIFFWPGWSAAAVSRYFCLSSVFQGTLSDCLDSDSAAETCCCRAYPLSSDLRQPPLSSIVIPHPLPCTRASARSQQQCWAFSWASESTFSWCCHPADRKCPAVSSGSAPVPASSSFYSFVGTSTSDPKQTSASAWFHRTAHQ